LRNRETQFAKLRICRNFDRDGFLSHKIHHSNRSRRGIYRVNGAGYIAKRSRDDFVRRQLGAICVAGSPRTQLVSHLDLIDRRWLCIIEFNGV
jgi:hypothetical protein